MTKARVAAADELTPRKRATVSTRRRAIELRVTGWVRNRSDGSVEAVFTGEASAVERALRFVEVGPEHARVDSVETSPLDANAKDLPTPDDCFRVL